MIRSAVIAGVMVLLVACDDAAPALPLVGTIERDRIELVAEANERIVEIAVKEGDSVSAGTLIVRLDAAVRKAELRAAEAQRDAAAERFAELVRGPRRERIREAQARLDGARENLQVQNNELARTQTLVERNLASESDLDRARNAREAADAEVAALTATLDELIEGATAEELSQAKAAVAQADAEIDLARIALERMQVNAPRAGLIDALPYELGERPPAGGTVAVLLDGATVYARVYVPEPLRPQIRVGLAATVVVDGIEAPLDARVRYVSADPVFTPYFSLTQRDRSRLAYVAEVEIVDADAAQVPIGQPAEVDFPDLQ